MDWEIVFYQEPGNTPVEDFLNSQPQKVRAKIIRNIVLLKEFGPNIGFPLVSNVERNIWELRTVFQGNQYRFLFSLVSGRIILLTNGFSKKTNKIPQAEIDVARRRLKRYLEGEYDG